MKFIAPMLVVSDMERSKRFYRDVLGLRVTMDFGANVTLTGGFSLQTEESWRGFIRREDIFYGGNSMEVYFEESDFDAFIGKLAAIPGIEYLHPAEESSWGQRAVRFYDPDRHIIEVGESIKDVCRRFLASGMTAAQAAARMDVPEKLVRAWMPK